MDARTHEVGTPVNYSFSSGEGRALIRGAAQEAGWSGRRGAEQLIGLWAAGTLVLLLVVGLALLLDRLLR